MRDETSSQKLTRKDLVSQRLTRKDLVLIASMVAYIILGIFLFKYMLGTGDRAVADSKKDFLEFLVDQAKGDAERQRNLLTKIAEAEADGVISNNEFDDIIRFNKNSEN